MKIQKIDIENYKGIKDLSLSLNQKNTVFLGENGTSKTSILNAITIVFSQIITRLQSKKNQINLLKDDISFKENHSKISLGLEINGAPFDCYRRIERGSNKKTHSTDSLNSIISILKENIEMPTTPTPIFVNYGVHRSVFNVPLRIRNKHDDFSELVAFENCLNPVTDFRTFFEWYRNQEDIENELVRDNKDYYDVPLRSVQNAIYTFLPEIRSLRIRRKPRLQMVVTKNDETLQVTQLSDGEKCLLALVGDIARRLAIANPLSDDPLDGSGLVLVDEVELHLHPKWQRYIIANLQSTFPNIQFVISTHSPQVLGELKNTNIVKLIRKNGRLTTEIINSMFGQDCNLILEKYMGTNKENSGISDDINELFDLIDNKEFNKAEPLYNELSGILSPNHSELVRADILIRRGKINL